MEITELDKQILEKYGWEIVCESPFEIEHVDGSMATGTAAEYILLHLKLKEEDDGHFDIDDENLKFNGGLDGVYKVLKKFVREECLGSDFDMLSDEQTMQVLKSWWIKNKSKFK